MRKVYAQQWGPDSFKLVSEEPGYATFNMSLNREQAEALQKHLTELLFDEPCCWGNIHTGPCCPACMPFGCCLRDGKSCGKAEGYCGDCFDVKEICKCKKGESNERVAG